MSQQQVPACATWSKPGPGPSGALEDSHVASTLSWKPGRHSHSSPHMHLGGKTEGPSSRGVGHSHIFPGLTQGKARVVLGREAGTLLPPQGSGGLSGQTSPQGTEAGGSTEPQGQPAPLTSPLHFPSDLLFRGIRRQIFGTVLSRRSRRPGGTKRAPSPQRGLCPTPGSV